MKLPFGDLMKQAQQLQARVEALQRELASAEVIGEAGGGLVRVTMDGSHGVRRVHIDAAVYSDDREVLEDLIAAACNDAVRRVEALRKERMGALAGGLSLPPGLNLPFGS